MAINDIYELRLAGQLNGSVSVNTYYYQQQQNRDSSFISDEEAVLNEWVTTANGPFDTMNNFMTDQFELICGTVQRVSPTVGRILSANITDATGVITDGNGIPAVGAVQFSWYSNPASDDEISNRVFLMGFDNSTLQENTFTNAFINAGDDIGLELSRYGDLNQPGNYRYFLQYRRNTTAPVGEWTFLQASVPFLRPYLVRTAQRQPFSCT